MLQIVYPLFHLHEILVINLWQIKNLQEDFGLLSLKSYMILRNLISLNIWTVARFPQASIQILSEVRGLILIRLRNTLAVQYRYLELN